MSMRESARLQARRCVTRTLATIGLPAWLIAAGACSDEKSATDLHTEGPPMVMQIFVMEREAVGTASRERLRLAFGDHPDIPTPEEDSLVGDDREMETAVARGGSGGNARLRIVFDELLRGNDIEEIQCADGSYSRVPYGATPDDIKRCSGPNLADCEAVCIGPGGPIGILDLNGDGAVDDAGGTGYRMINYGDGEIAASVVCDGEPVPLVRQGANRSFYNPSGNQLIPAPDNPNDDFLKLDGLGPAMMLFPEIGLPVGSTCTVTFRPEVVDKDGNPVCAPPGGDVNEDCPGEGDTEEIEFQVEPMAFRATVPSATSGPLDPNNVTIQLSFVTTIDTDTLGAITLSTGGVDVPVEVTQVSATDTTSFRVVAPGGYLPESEYTVTVSTDLRDSLGGAPDEPLTLTFTTGPAPEPLPMSLTKVKSP